MFSIFGSKNRPNNLVVSEDEFWTLLDSECADYAIFDAQGDEHSEIDMRLVEKIDALLEPHIGDWEESDDWYHKLDYYGDGVRSLLFNKTVFQPDFIDSLQCLLTGEHEPFCILCQVFEDFSGDDDSRIGSVAIFSDRLMVSRPLAKLLVFAE